MKLQQLRYVWEVARHGLNISATAESLYTSQPGVSKQIRLLEDELGIRIFSRNGKHLTGITPAGKAIVEISGRILNEAGNIKRVAQEFRDEKQGTLSIAATQTEAKYALPSAIAEFQRRFPGVTLRIHQSSLLQAGEMVSSGSVDLAITAEGVENFDDLVAIPCYRWAHAVILPRDHPLAKVEPLTLEALARYPVITYVFGFAGKSRAEAAFAAGGMTPNVVCTATDGEVIKTYVDLGLGIGIMARMAFDPARETRLCLRDASHLFEPGTTWLILSRHLFVRGYMHEFIRTLSPHLTPERVEKALGVREQEEIRSIFSEADLPIL